MSNACIWFLNEIRDISLILVRVDLAGWGGQYMAVGERLQPSVLLGCNCTSRAWRTKGCLSNCHRWCALMTLYRGSFSRRPRKCGASWFQISEEVIIVDIIAISIKILKKNEVVHDSTPRWDCNKMFTPWKITSLIFSHLMFCSWKSLWIIIYWWCP